MVLWNALKFSCFNSGILFVCHNIAYILLQCLLFQCDKIIAALQSIFLINTQRFSVNTLPTITKSHGFINELAVQKIKFVTYAR